MTTQEKEKLISSYVSSSKSDSPSVNGTNGTTTYLEDVKIQQFRQKKLGDFVVRLKNVSKRECCVCVCVRVCCVRVGCVVCVCSCHSVCLYGVR